MHKAVIIVGTCCYNKGSEALVQGCAKAVKNAFPDCEIVLSGSEAVFGSHLRYPNIDRYVHRFAPWYRQLREKGSIPARGILAVYRRLYKFMKNLCAIQYTELLRQCQDADAVIVIAADNYDNVYAMFEYMHNLNLCLKNVVKGKLILYDCSLASEDIDARTIGDFMLFDSITARETITLQALMRQDRLRNKVLYYPDPAFLLEPIECRLPAVLIPGKTIGINASPLVMKNKHCDNENNVFRAYQNLVEEILHKTDQNVLFLPHVMGGKDVAVLKRLYAPYTGNVRVGIVDDESYSAGQLKYMISQCSAFVGARTHSTIAAYSTCVPTLVIGYSIKSYGIARDLFGTDEGYVIPCDGIRAEGDISEAFFRIFNAKECLRIRLAEKMPSYKMQAGSFTNLLRDSEGRLA